MLVRYRALFRELQARSARNRVEIYLTFKRFEGKPKDQQGILGRFGIKDIREFWCPDTIIPIADEWNRGRRYGRPLSDGLKEILRGFAEGVETLPVGIGGAGIIAHDCYLEFEDPRFAGRPCVALMGFLKPLENGLWESSISAAGATRLLVSVNLGATRRERVEGVEAVIQAAQRAVGRTAGRRNSRLVGSSPRRYGRVAIINNPDLLAAVWINQQERGRGTTVLQAWDEVVEGAPRELVPANLQRSLRDFQRYFVSRSPFRRGLSREQVDGLAIRINPSRGPPPSDDERLCRLFIGNPRVPQTWTQLMLGQDEGRIKEALPWLFRSAPKEQQAQTPPFLESIRRSS